MTSFAEWIIERERVRKAKEAGKPKPWSEDKTFQQVYFCNVHREDDRVTKFIRYGYSHFVEHPNFAANMCMWRLVNRWQSIDQLGFMERWRPAHFRKVAAANQPFWGGAYVVTTHGRKMGKVDYACEVLAAAFKQCKKMNLEDSLATAHQELTQLEGFGSFMAAQVVADLKNTAGHPLQNAVDWHHWSAPGPGSLRGLNWYFQGVHSAPASQRIGPSDYDWAIRQVEAESAPALHHYKISMCMQDLQNCLCEFDKYCRVSTGVGRSKRKYNGESE